MSATSKPEVTLIETDIFGFRLWMVMGLVLTGLLVISKCHRVASAVLQ